MRCAPGQGDKAAELPGELRGANGEFIYILFIDHSQNWGFLARLTPELLARPQ